jgi:predicted glycoside hydrolase/deacetylase ChbG (UPF0249 family)
MEAKRSGRDEFGKAHYQLLPNMSFLDTHTHTHTHTHIFCLYHTLLVKSKVRKEGRKEGRKKKQTSFI